MANISNQQDAQCWIAASRTRECEDGKRRRRKDEGNQTWITEMVSAQQLAKLDMLSAHSSERKYNHDRAFRELKSETGQEVASLPAPEASPQERVVIDLSQDRVSQPSGSTIQKQYIVKLPQTDSRL